MYLFLALAFEIFVRHVPDTATFAIDALAIIAGTFVGPGIIELISYVSRVEYSGLPLGGMTLLSCTLITLALRFLFSLFFLG